MEHQRRAFLHASHRYSTLWSTGVGSNLRNKHERIVLAQRARQPRGAEYCENVRKVFSDGAITVILLSDSV